MSFMSQFYSVIIYRVISAPGHGKEVFDFLNSINKRYISQLISIVLLMGSKTFDSQILVHFLTQNNDVILGKELKNNMSKEHRKHGVINQVKYIKRNSKRKWTDIEYHVQDNADVAHKDVKMYCNTNR